MVHFPSPFTASSTYLKSSQQFTQIYFPALSRSLDLAQGTGLVKILICTTPPKLLCRGSPIHPTTQPLLTLIFFTWSKPYVEKSICRILNKSGHQIVVILLQPRTSIFSCIGVSELYTPLLKRSGRNAIRTIFQGHEPHTY